MLVQDHADSWESEIQRLQKKFAIQPFEILSQVESETLLAMIEDEPGVVQTFLLLHLEPAKSRQVFWQMQGAMRELISSQMAQVQAVPEPFSHQFEAAVERKWRRIALQKESAFQKHPLTILEWVERIDRCFCL